MSDYCFECDFAYDSVTTASAVEALRGYVPQFRGALVGDGIRVRSSPWSWSALEYACHMRDVFALYSDRVQRVVAQDQPDLHGMERDGLAIREKYNEQDPATVLDQLEANGTEPADVLAGLSPEEWQRTGKHAVRTSMSNIWMAANTVHEARHHLMDIKRVLDLVSG